MVDKKEVSRKGLSPLMATVLLSVIAISALAALFFWTTAVRTEEIEKFGEPIESACQRVSYEASLSSEKINVENSGEIPIYAINLVVVKEGEDIVRFLRPDDGLISPEETDFVTASIQDLSGIIDSIVVVPVIVGESAGLAGENKLHACADQSQTIL